VSIVLNKIEEEHIFEAKLHVMKGADDGKSF
jgi:hypothetical protein